MPTSAPTVRIVSFGYGHGAPPPATVTADVRDLFRDPHGNPAMQQLTGMNPAVRANVLTQPGAGTMVRDLARLAVGIVDVTGQDVTVAVGCVGGRHRSVALANELGRCLCVKWEQVCEVEHRDVDKPVLATTRRPGAADRAAT